MSASITDQEEFVKLWCQSLTQTFGDQPMDVAAKDINLTELLREAKTRAAGSFERVKDVGRAASKDLPESVKSGQAVDGLIAAATGLGESLGGMMKQTEGGRKVMERVEGSFTAGSEAYQRARGSDIPPAEVVEGQPRVAQRP